MAKRVDTAYIDKLLDIIKTGVTGYGPCNEQTACAGEPTDYTSAHTTNKVANVTMTGTDFTIGAGASGYARKLTIGAKTNGGAGYACGSNATIDHVALTDTVNSKLIYVTTLASNRAVTTADFVTFGSWTVEIGTTT